MHIAQSKAKFRADRINTRAMLIFIILSNSGVLHIVRKAYSAWFKFPNTRWLINIYVCWRS